MTKVRTSALWHPFTQHGLQPAMEKVARAKGAWIELADGRRILDAISSWWVVTHGHLHPHIAAAIAAQAEILDQVIFAGFTHEPAEDVASQLVALAPDGLEHVFLSDSGSTAVEVALKMALGYFRNTGGGRARIVALEHAYHGDTIGTMSAGARGVFTASYEPVLFEVDRLPFPYAGREQETIDAFEAICSRGDTAALIVEPLLLGAGGMLIYAPSVLRELKEICAAHGALFIADEVMTGWGRTGTLFACEQADVSPDIMCLAKGLTGGALPLAATLCTPAIFDAHYSRDRSRMFFHSSSFTANPIACAAARANLEVWQNEPVLERINTLSRHQRSAMDSLSLDPAWENARTIGTVAAIDLKVGDGGYLASSGPMLYDYFISLGFLVRPLGNTIYVMPPYCVTAVELDTLYAAISDAPVRLKIRWCG